jgi:hypothetical protein
MAHCEIPFNCHVNIARIGLANGVDAMEFPACQLKSWEAPDRTALPEAWRVRKRT